MSSNPFPIKVLVGNQNFSANLCFLHLFMVSWLELSLLGTVLKTCPHNSSLEQVVLEGNGSLQKLPTWNLEFDVAIDAAVNHLHALKTIEIYPTPN
jgi:hypothetical protein